MSIRHSLLALLSTGPKYGQQLKAEFESRTGELWPLNVGQVYTTLNRLERDGLVTATEEPDAALRPYDITATGRTELETWFRSPPGDEPPPRDELVMKVMIATSVAPAAAGDIIQTHRRQLLEGMRRYTRIKAGDDASVATSIMCDAELFRLEAAVRWLDSVDARLRAGARLDLPAERELPLDPPAAAPDGNALSGAPSADSTISNEVSR
jgi:DNA-binding PadR family transcriptional regulator